MTSGNTMRLERLDTPDERYRFAAPFRAPQGSPIRELFKYVGRPGMISFAGGYPSKDLFDREGLAHALHTAYRNDPITCLQYGDTAGSPLLRRSLAELMGAREVNCSPDDVIVTTGSQQGFDLLLRTLIAPGDTALIEEPAYPAAIQALRLAGANIVTVRTDRDGIDVDALAAQLDAWPQADERGARLFQLREGFGERHIASRLCEGRGGELFRRAVGHHLNRDRRAVRAGIGRDG